MCGNHGAGGRVCQANVDDQIVSRVICNLTELVLSEREHSEMANGFGMRPWALFVYQHAVV